MPRDKGHNFSHQATVWKGSALKEIIRSQGRKCITFRVKPFSKGDKINLDTVASLESV